MSEEDQGHAFKMLAAVLWMGNISLQLNSENYVEVLADEGSFFMLGYVMVPAL